MNFTGFFYIIYMRSIETQAPHIVKQGYRNIFLGGSIEMGTAELWQKRIISVCERT